MKEQRNSARSNGKLGWGIRVAYGCGDTACNVVYGIMSTLLVLFYTDYVGVAAATVGLIMLVSRFFDGVSDVIMGFIVERTHSKWGKARPWVLWMAVPYALSAVLLFAVPHTTPNMQALYIFVTYNFTNTICFTALNLPYGSLSTLMTRDSDERSLLSIVRMGISPFGRIMVVTGTLPFVRLLGDDQAAWVKVMSVWAVAAILLLLICFFFCEETVEIEAAKKQDKIPLAISLKALFTNQYFWAGLMVWTLQNVIFTLTGTILPYYCKYTMGNATTLYSTLYLVETIVLVAATFACPALLAKFGKRNMSLIGAVIALAGHLLFALNPSSVSWLFFSCIIRAIGLAPMNSIIFGVIGDAVEFGQWKTHIRQESLIFAGSSVGFKIGVGITSAIITKMLDAAGYVSSTTGSAVQPESAVNMITNIYKFGPVIVWIMVIIVMALYQLDKKYPMIMKELAEREARGEL